MEYKNTWTYHAIVPFANFGFVLFNHGTESKPKTRTAQHINECKAQGLTYEVLEEKQDRLFGTDVIAPNHDDDFIIRLVNHINDTILKDSSNKALTLKDWFKTLTVLSPINRGYYDALKLSHLSETECCMIPDSVSRPQLAIAVKWVERDWYYKNKSLRVSAKAYKDKTEWEKKMAAKPIPRALHKIILNLIRQGKKFIELLNYRFIRVQSIELAYLLYTQREFQYINKIRVILVADDKEKHLEVYNILKNNSKFEFVECDSDADIAEEYKMEYKPDLDIMNPPYDGNLHLEILSSVLAMKKPNATVISIQPIRDWLEDPIADFKQKDTLKKYKANILPQISAIKLVLRNDANKLFEINSRSNLGIILFNNTSYTVPDPAGKSIFVKLHKAATLQEKLAFDKKAFGIPVVTHLLNEADGRATAKLIVADNGPIAKRGYTDASDAQGWAWLNLATNQQEYDALVHYLNSEFVKDLVKLANSPRSIYKYLPIPKLDKKYTDTEYCNMFGLTMAEQEVLFDSSKWNLVSPEVF